MPETNVIRRTGAAVLILAGLALTPSRVAAQPCGNPANEAQNCFAQNNPLAVEMKDFSRHVSGEAFIGAATTVRIRNCGPNVRTRYVDKLPIVLNLCGPRECDELMLPPPCLVPRGYILTGLYSSVTRLNDPCLNVDGTGVVLANPRIGTFSASGRVQSCDGVYVGFWRLEGTISTNSSAPPLLPEGCGNCYVCHHHTGLLTITGLKDKTPPCQPANIYAFMQFDTSQTNCPVPGPTCNDLKVCEVAFTVHDGTADGVYRQPCCIGIIDDHGNPNPTAIDESDPGSDLELEELGGLP